MARFVLVHGAFAGAWIWGPLMDRLNAAGHSAEAFDLPGLGDDHTPASEVTLDACVTRLCEVLATSPEPAVVAGNSMGGIIATQGAARCPEHVTSLVYVTAFVPKDGQSLLDLTKLPEGAGDQVQANITIEGDPPVATMPAAASRQALYGSCREDVAAWAIARQRPQPLAPFATPVSIPPGALDGINGYYVLCTRDRAIPPSLQRRMVAENVFAGVIALDTDHTPQLSMTDELAKALQRFATLA
jgi:pimeloyl-ACP methyl ester carboxylesterase